MTGLLIGSLAFNILVSAWIVIPEIVRVIQDWTGRRTPTDAEIIQNNFYELQDTCRVWHNSLWVDIKNLERRMDGRILNLEERQRNRDEEEAEEENDRRNSIGHRTPRGDGFFEFGVGS